MHTCAQLLIVFVLAPTPSPVIKTIDEAIEALENRRSIRGKITRDLGREAARRIKLGDDWTTHRRLVTIAREGGALDELSGALVFRVSDDPRLALPALRTLVKLPAAAVRPHSTRLSEALMPMVREAETPSRLVSLAAELCGRFTRPRLVAGLLRTWQEEREESDERLPARWTAMVRGAALSHEARAMFRELLRLPAPTQPRDERSVREALNTLAGNERVAREVLDALPRTPTPRLLSCVPGLPRSLRARAEPHLRAGLLRWRGPRLGCALETAAAIELPNLFPRVLQAARSGSEPVRVVAYRLLPRLVNREKSPVLKTQAQEALTTALEQESGGALAAAIGAAARLELRSALQQDLLTWIEEDQPLEVRLAALRAAPGALDAEPSTLHSLIDLLSDPEVSRPAWLALKRLTRVKLPLRQDLWRAWLRRKRQHEQED